jgi:drug/metabolite transporter (DMT)-like permease
MVAFAANSVLCRLALSNTNNSPISFTALRIISGALVLLLLLKNKRSLIINLKNKRLIFSGISLFLYMIFFSIGYVDISSGMGAFVLFSTVQITMILLSLFKGQVPSSSEGLGIVITFAGFLYLLLPSFSTSSLTATLMMVISGGAWGIFSFLGKDNLKPLESISFSFLFCLPIAFVMLIVYGFQMTQEGFFLAVTSGAVTSALGYSVWYLVLKKLKTTTASIVQLTVPIIATFAGVLLLDELITMRLLIASALLCLGILIKTSYKPYRKS